MSFTLPELPYAYDALGPYMSKETLEYHHDKHHQAYVTNGNNLIKGTGSKASRLRRSCKESFGKNAPLFNNAGQHYNHIAFLEMDEAEWRRQNSGRARKGDRRRLGSVEKAKEEFIQAGVTQFGSGWAWLARQGRQGRRHQDAEWRKPARSRRPSRSSASMSGSIPITSTIATAGRTISRPSSTTSSTGNMSPNFTPRRLEVGARARRLRRPWRSRPRGGASASPSG